MADFVTSSALVETQRLHPAKALGFSIFAGAFDLFGRRSPRLDHAENFLNIGCGSKKISGWCNADIPRIHDIVSGRASLPDWMMDATRTWKCPDNAWDGIYTEHVLEHMTYSQALAVLKEACRTLKPGAWVRIITPDLEAYVENYVSKGSKLKHLGHPAIAVSSLTQSWGHVSVWDADLMCEALKAAGFRIASKTSFGVGADSRLIKDQRDRSLDSLYVEAQK